MNGIHDMGGMHGMGPIEYDKREPVFHEPWEGRAWALVRAMGRWTRPKNFRYEIESIPATEYLRMSYYERFIFLLTARLKRSNLVTAAELETGRAEPGAPKPTQTPSAPVAGDAANIDVAARPPRFKVGQHVRARNINPVGHTRLPRYVRGKRGTITRYNGAFGFQDTDVNGDPLSRKPQHVYTVRFAAQELWGEDARQRDSVYLDLWDDHLERI